LEQEFLMTTTKRIGWIGVGRMGTPMAERLLKAGHDVTIWNRTRAKAERLAGKGGKIVDKPVDLAGCDVVFAIVSTGKDVEQVVFGKDGLLSSAKKPKMLVDCSSISVEESAAIRRSIGRSPGFFGQSSGPVEAGKAPTFTSVRKSSGESRLNLHSFLCRFFCVKIESCISLDNHR